LSAHSLLVQNHGSSHKPVRALLPIFEYRDFTTPFPNAQTAQYVLALGHNTPLHKLDRGCLMIDYW
jgi:hypothetical protein